MSFNIQKFKTSKLQFREATIELPELQCFFEADEKPAFKIRNLSANEIAKINDAVRQNKDIGALITNLMSNDSLDKITAIKEALGMTDSVPDDVVKRIATMELGTIEPKFDQETCVRFATHFATQFYAITNKIYELTGLGSLLGE